MVNRLVWLGAAFVAFGVAGCGDDTGGSTSGSGGTGNSGSGGDGNSGTGNSGTGNSGTGNSGTGNSGTGGTGATGGTGTGGAGGSSSNPDAATFCAGFDNVCGYGDGFADEAACLAAYNGYDEARKTCVNEHLGNSEGGAPNQSTHCPHAAGAGPCS